MSYSNKFKSAFVNGHNFQLAVALCGLVLLDRTPSDKATAVAENKSGEKDFSKTFKECAVKNCVTKLTAPACVAESCEAVAFGNGRRSIISVGFLVMMMREVIERLKGVHGIGVK